MNHKLKSQLRIGALLKFKPGVTKTEAAMALNGIRNLLDVPYNVARTTPDTQAALNAGQTVRYRPDHWWQEPFKMTDIIEEYDNNEGSPVWYIP